MLGRLSAGSIAIALLSCAALAQKPETDVSPWCKNDPETTKNAGLVSHGPTPIGPWTSAERPAKLPATQWITLETAHLRFARSLPQIEVELAEDVGRRSP